MQVQRIVGHIWAAMGLPSHSIANTEWQNVRSGMGGKPKKDKSDADSEAERDLRSFYSPFNRRLFETLGKDLAWGDER